MNKKQGVAIIIAVVIVAVSFLWYAQIISNLQMNPQELGSIKVTRHAEISSTISDRNTIIKVIIAITIVALFFLRDKKVEKQSEYQMKTIRQARDNKSEVSQKDEIVLSLLNLKEKGIITEEEFLDKISKL